jgi:hypothetical protein
MKRLRVANRYAARIANRLDGDDISVNARRECLSWINALVTLADELYRVEAEKAAAEFYARERERDG